MLLNGKEGRCVWQVWTHLSLPTGPEACACQLALVGISRHEPSPCPLCLSEAVAPLCGSLSGTRDFSSPPILLIFRASEEAHSYLGNFYNSVKAAVSTKGCLSPWMAVGGRLTWVEARTVTDQATGGPCHHCGDV